MRACRGRSAKRSGRPGQMGIICAWPRTPMARSIAGVEVGRWLPRTNSIGIGRDNAHERDPDKAGSPRPAPCDKQARSASRRAAPVAPWPRRHPRSRASRHHSAARSDRRRRSVQGPGFATGGGGQARGRPSADWPVSWLDRVGRTISRAGVPSKIGLLSLLDASRLRMPDKEAFSRRAHSGYRRIRSLNRSWPRNLL